MPLYDYLAPKLDFKRKFNHRQSFLYKGRLTVRTIRKFRIGSSLQIESRIGSSIRNRIESRSFAGPYVSCQLAARFFTTFMEYVNISKLTLLAMAGVFRCRSTYMLMRQCHAAFTHSVRQTASLINTYILDSVDLLWRVRGFGHRAAPPARGARTYLELMPHAVWQSVAPHRSVTGSLVMHRAFLGFAIAFIDMVSIQHTVS